MAYRVILVPLLGDPADQSALDMARAVSERMHAHIIGLHVRTPMATLISANMFDVAPVSAEVINRLEEEAVARAAAARGKFHSWQRACGIDTATSPARLAKHTAEWVDVDGLISDEVASRARTADLVVLARSTREYAAASDLALDGALFSSGRPALVVPGDIAAGPFETVVVAWNDSPESAHAVAASWSLIGRARRVVVYVGADDERLRRSADNFVSHLGWRGYGPATVATGAPGDVGDGLLAVAQREKAGLIVMGAYTHSRLRHFVFGGVTSHVLGHAAIPVLMAH